MTKRISKLILRTAAAALLLFTFSLQSGAVAPPPHNYCLTQLGADVLACTNMHPNRTTQKQDCILWAYCMLDTDEDYCECNCEIVSNPPMLAGCKISAEMKLFDRFLACPSDSL